MSYDDTDLSDLNRARGALGDTSNDSTTELLTDDHIDAVLMEDGYNLGVAKLAEELAAKYASKPGSVTLPSGLSVSWAYRVAQWNRVATQYRALAALDTAAELPARVSHYAQNVTVW